MKAEHQRIDAFELCCWRRLLRIPWTARIPNLSILRKSNLNIHWKDWYGSWSSNILITWCKELTHLKRAQCWERLKVGGEGDNRVRWLDGTKWTCVWVNSGSWWWTGRPGMLQSMGSQRVGHDWVAELMLSITQSQHSADTLLSPELPVLSIPNTTVPKIRYLIEQLFSFSS